MARSRYTGSSLSGGVPQSCDENQDQSEFSTSSCTLQVCKLSNITNQVKTFEVVTHLTKIHLTVELNNNVYGICSVIVIHVVMLTRFNRLYYIDSAGIGRTGTYIALDALYKSGKASGKINVAEYVKVMRSNRMNMVQTYVR